MVEPIIGSEFKIITVAPGNGDFEILSITLPRMVWVSDCEKISEWNEIDTSRIKIFFNGVIKIYLGIMVC